MKRKLRPSLFLAAQEAAMWQETWTQFGITFLTNSSKTAGSVRLQLPFTTAGVSIFGYTDEPVRSRR